jgi:fatty-acid peroxygenase
MTVPHARGFDQSLLIVRDGYDFITKQCEALGSDIFRGRLMLRNVICMRGSAAAELFYSSGKFTRVGAMPITILMLLQDFGSVQLLDDDAHRHRKAMFLEVGRAQDAKRLADHFARERSQTLPRWEHAERIVLFEEMEAMLTHCGAAWAGIPLSEREAGQRTREYSEMLAATGTFGPRTLRALWLRRRTERWARDIVGRARAGALPAAPGTALHTIAHHRGLEGKLLTTRIAAVELLNVLRAIVAVARFIAFAAKALHEHPSARLRIERGDALYLDHFVQEVRRTAPFFPIIGGRAREGFEWNGHAFRRGTWVLLDLYGTDHHPAIWSEPARFDPDRFLRKMPTPFELVPQGAGDPTATHRCPGEDLTLELMKTAVQQLMLAMTYEVPAQDLSVAKSTIPALPASGVIFSSIRARTRGSAASTAAPAAGHSLA